MTTSRFFASQELAARIERADGALIAACVDTARRLHPDDDVFATPIAGGVAAFTGPHSPLNKVAGLGFAGPIDENKLTAIERAFAERDCPVQAEVSSLADPTVGAMLTKRGYVLQGVENVLGLRLPFANETPSRLLDIQVSPCPDEDYANWLDVVVTGFLAADTQGVASHEAFMRESLERVIGDFTAVSGMRRYLARRGDSIAGGASMRLTDGVAQMCGASTLPEHRRRGAHYAMLDARLRDAASAGCDIAVITTLPGSKSQENVQKQGFELLFSRTILVREC